MDGIKLELFNDKTGKGLYKGIVWPNDEYEYETEDGGVFKVCVSLTDSMFYQPDLQQIKTQFKFASDFHREKKDQKDEEAFHVRA